MTHTHIQTVISKSHKLIHFEVNELRQINKLSSFKPLVIECLEDLFKFYNINDFNVIYEIYAIEEEYLNKRNSLIKQFPNDVYEKNVNHLCNSIEFIFKQYDFLFDFIENGIYYDCLYHQNKLYPMYQLQDIFFEKLVNNYIQELDLPKNYFDSLIKKKHDDAITLDINVRKCIDFNAFSYFQENKDCLKTFDWYNDPKDKCLDDFIKSKKDKTTNQIPKKSSTNVLEEILGKEKLEERKKIRNSKDYKGHQLAEHKWITAITILSKYGNCNAVFNYTSQPEGSFDSFPLNGFKDLIKEQTYVNESFYFKYIDDNDNHKTFEFLSKTKELFLFFTELSLYGEIVGVGETFFKKSSTSFQDENGNITKENEYYQMPIFKNLSIQVGKKADWDSSYNHKLRDLINVLNIDELSLSFDEDDKPIIKIS